MSASLTAENEVAPVESHHTHRIVCAAIKLASGRVICGVRHFDALMRQSLPEVTSEAHELLAGHDQGFVDNRYQYLTREQAYKVALMAFQFDPDSAEYSGLRGTLFSEDVW